MVAVIVRLPSTSSAMIAMISGCYTRLHCCTHGPVHHRNGIFSHTQVHICGILSGNDGTHTHKHCDMHMHFITAVVHVCIGH